MNDTKIIEKGTSKIQKRILNDYLSTLYDKFAEEDPEDRFSFASFCRMRPSFGQLYHANSLFMHPSSEKGFEAQVPQASQNCRYTISRCIHKKQH